VIPGNIKVILRRRTYQLIILLYLYIGPTFCIQDFTSFSL